MTQVTFPLLSAESTTCDVCGCDRVVNFSGHVLCGTCFGIVSSVASRISDGPVTELDVWLAYEKAVMLRGNLRKP